MRIRFFSRTQAVCLAISLFLGVFCLGLGLGMLGAGVFSPKEEAAAVFAFLEETPTMMATPVPEQTPSPTPLFTSQQEVTEINLFSFDTVPPAFTPAPPSVNPLPSDTPVAAPGEFRMEVIRKNNANQTGDGKRVLIYHTHTYEAYEPTAANPYEQTERWRTKDNEHNVVRVGEELANLLTALGYTVVHDTTAYEPPVLSTSYTRSLKMLEASVARGETYDLYIDLHRDAYTSAMANNNSVMVGDQSVAKLMILIGTGTGQKTAEFSEKPEWEKNLSIAQAITDSLNQQVNGLCRPVKTKSSGRFNQHIAPCCILVEAGNNKNTLEEVLASMPYLADALNAVLDEKR